MASKGSRGRRNRPSTLGSTVGTLKRRRKLAQASGVTVRYANGTVKKFHAEAFTPEGADGRDTGIWVDYEAYLASPEWKRLRAAVLKRDKYRCRACGSGYRLQAHHLTYDRICCELLTDLVALCYDCHKAHHDGIQPYVPDLPKPRPSRNSLKRTRAQKRPRPRSQVLVDQARESNRERVEREREQADVRRARQEQAWRDALDHHEVKLPESPMR